MYQDKTKIATKLAQKGNGDWGGVDGGNCLTDHTAKNKTTLMKACIITNTYTTPLL